MAFGFVRKKNASVMWNRDRDVMIVAPEIIAMLKVVEDTNGGRRF